MLDRERLAVDHLPLLNKCVTRYVHRVGVSIDDGALRGAALEALVLAARSWDPDLDRFAGFAWRNMIYAMQTELRRADHHTPGERRRGAMFDGRPLQGGAVSLDAIQESDSEAEEEGTLHNLLAGSADTARSACARVDAFRALDRLRDRERLVMLSLMVGYEQREIGERIGVTESRVSQIVKKSRRKMAA